MLALSPVFRDHMILQRNKPVRITGTASPCAAILVRFDQAFFYTDSDRSGNWTVKVPPHDIGGDPHEIYVISEGEELRISDVLFGDVWVAGGQSNMELRLQNCDQKELQSVSKKNTSIRFYSASDGKNARWYICNASDRLKMSGVAFYFANEVFMLTKIPIGIIDCSYGGSSISNWISTGTLEKTEVGRTYIKKYESAAKDVTYEQYLHALSEFKSKADDWNEKTINYRLDHPESSWKQILDIYGMAPWPEPVGPGSPFCPGALYDTMLMPLCSLSIAGFLFYQGEADAYNHRYYADLMRQMVFDWRAIWKDEALPFLFVQLPMFRFSSDAEDYNWPNQRLAQERAAQIIPHAYMAVVTDQGEMDNIHPTSKKDVGERLAKLALRYIYGLNIEAEAPGPDRVYRDLPDKLRIDFRNTGGRLVSKGDEIKTLEISEDGGDFHAANAKIDRNSLIIDVDPGSVHFVIRYAWASFCTINIWGSNGLPLRTFQLDFSSRQQSALVSSIKE